VSDKRVQKIERQSDMLDQHTSVVSRLTWRSSGLVVEVGDQTETYDLTARKEDRLSTQTHLTQGPITGPFILLGC